MSRFNISETVIQNWQAMADTIATAVSVPAALIIQLVDEDIEIFVASSSEGNPYHPGDKEHFDGSGLYCERVIKTQKELLVPNALLDKEWCNNPDIALNMISYLGLPILFPDGEPFGTICVLDSKENAYSATSRSLLVHFRDLVQVQLGLLRMNHDLGDENKSLRDYIDEIKTLRGIIPICSYCKSIRNDEGYYEAVETYMHRHSGADFSHTICPKCLAKHHPEIETKIMEQAEHK